MVYISRGKTRKMALNGLERSFMNDSLEAKDWNGSVVAPESSLNGETDFGAFSPNQEELHLGLFPNWMVAIMQDKSNWKNRVAGISRIQSVIDSVPDNSLHCSDLAKVLEFLSSPMNDTHFKVNQMGLELLESFVKKVGKRIKPQITTLVTSILVKMGTNKYVIKQAGLRVLMELMRRCGPQLVVREIINCGLYHKTSRVREESINSITAALLTFPSSEFDTMSLARDIAPTMVDNKPKVRQASFECVALVCECMGRTDMKDAVSIFVAVKDAKTGESVMSAFHARVARKRLPRLNEDGLVEHSIPVVNCKLSNPETGTDVDWILSAGGNKVQSTGDASKGQQTTYSDLRKRSVANGGAPMFRPYRSAGKRLPWEIDAEEAAMNNQSIGSLKPPLDPFPKNPTTSLSPKHHPPSTTASVKRTGGSYAKMHLDKLSHTPATTVGPLAGTSTTVSMNGGLSSHIHHRNSEPTAGLRNYSLNAPLSSTLPPKMSTGVPLQRPSLPMSSAQRHNSLPQAFNNSSGYIPTCMESSANTSMTLTWPQAPAVHGGKGTTVHANHVGQPSVRMSQKISADAAGVVGGVHSSVKTSVSRPLSKPKVRNPFTLLNQKQNAVNNSGSLVPSLSSSPKQRDSPKHRDSPTQLERDFLASSNADGSIPSGWGESSWDEELFFKTIPEDTATLNSSLSSSLSSLCNGGEVESARIPGEFDNLKHIRKEAASRKAKLLSADNSASNSPETSRNSSVNLKLKKGQKSSSVESKASKPKRASDHIPSQASAVLTDKTVRKAKWDSTDGSTALTTQSVDLNLTYTMDRKKNDKISPTYSMAFVTKKQSTPTRTSRTFGQTKHEKHTPTEEPSPAILNEISLEGVSLDKEGKETQPKRKSRKVDPPRGNLPPPRLRSNSLGHDGSTERRPSIEKGGINTIDMEVSGVGSQNKASSDTSITPTNTSNSINLGQLSQSTKESLMRKRQKQQQDEEASQDSNKVQSASCSSTKKPPIPPGQDAVTTSAPVENVRKRNKRKNRVNSNSHSGQQTDSSPDEMPKNSGSLRSSRRNSITISDVDSSFNGGSPDELVELHPFNNPEQGLKDSIQNISSEDWSSKCAGTLGIRRVALYNPEVLQPYLHTVVLAVIKEVKNLRSSVARAAIACFGDLFATMRRAMEQDLDGIVRVLLHKTGESNTFIREDVDKVFNEIIGNVNMGKCLTALINGGLSHRNPHVRKAMSKFMYASVECYGPSKFLHASRDILEKALSAIVQLISDSSQDARYNGRKCLNLLWPEPDFEKIASRSLSDQQYKKVKDTVEHLKVKGVGDSPKENQSAKHHNGSRHSTGGTARVPAHGKGSLISSGSSSLSDYQGSTTSSGYSSGSSKPCKVETVSRATDMPLPDGLLHRLEANNWSERYEAVTELEEFVTTYPYSLASHLHKVFDVFCPRLTDRNSKVNLHALEAFSNMVTMVCNILVPVINNIIGALVPNLASRNATIHAMAMTVLDLISQCIDPIHLIQPVAKNGQFGNARVQPIMLMKLAELTPRVYSQKPQLVSRYVLPVMWHLITSKVPVTGDSKTATYILCEVLWQNMGQNFLDSASHLSPEHRKKFDEMISCLEKK